MDKAMQDVLFLDIETVGCVSSHDQLDERLKTQWARKASFLKRDEGITDEELFEQRAGIYAEFGKIVTIGLGYFHKEKKEDKLILRLKGLYDDDEKSLLQQFKEVVERLNPETLKLCAHNGREFDFPYLSRRMLVNGLTLPAALDLSGKKPWEVNHLDTMDMWKFGDWKHYTSLDLLASLFHIDSSKTDMDGSMVNEVYYKEQDLEKINQYCLQDVAVTAQLYLKLKSLDYKSLEIIETSPNSL